MKKAFSIILLCLPVFVLSACGTEQSESLVISTSEPSVAEEGQSSSIEQSEPAKSLDQASTEEIPSIIIENTLEYSAV